jgi:formylglycine-generating enzyme required for sulfatase activity
MNRTFCTFAALSVSVFLDFTLRAHAQTSPSVGLQLSAGAAHVTVTGPVNSAWTVQFNSALGKTNTWLPLANLKLTNGTALVDDISGPVSGNKFYRAAPQQSTPTNVINASLVWIAPGTFLMGSPTNEVGRELDEVQHPVTISRGFFVSKYLVTQGDFLALMGYNPSYFTGTHGGTDLSRPVEQVHWYAAAAYCSKLTQTEQQAGRLPTNWVYRLPTEAEWEYACRAGSTNRFSYGDDPGYLNLTNYSWYSANSASITHDVAQKLPNGLGLYDVHGDVYEWCQDWYDAYPATLAVDPQSPANGFQRVFRGGSWAYSGKYCRSAGRYSLDPTLPQNFVGFRVVAAPSP